MAKQRMILGDARKVVPRYPDGSFDVVMTDPPYGDPMVWEGEFGWHLDDANMDETLALTEWLMQQAARVLREDGILYLTAGDTILAEAMLAARRAGFTVRTFAWVKPSAMPTFPGQPWRKAWNPCIIAWRRLPPARTAWGDGGGSMNWLSAMPEQGKTRRRHPTQKPLPLFEYWLRRTPGRVLDPFAGSGTACVAARRLNLEAVGVELRKEYYDWAMERLNNTELGEGLRDSA